MEVHNKQILNLKLLQTIVDQLKKKQKKIVFTNGCFDLIHTGHTRYLQEARKCGDCLIVAVNSDDSIQRLKGKKRPILPLDERMEVLSGFYFIDYVISFEQNTPYDLIATLIPDILVKGGDWDLNQIVGKDIVELNGGKVMIIPEIPGASTTNIIDRILDLYSS